jgi:hypothetical protein
MGNENDKTPEPENPDADKGKNKDNFLGTGLSAGTVGGVLAFVAGGVGTIIAAIGDFGSDNGALAAARRNHVWLVVAAAASAALGLACGALYIIYKDRKVPLKFQTGMQVFGWFLILFAVLFLGIAAIAEDSLALWLTCAASATLGITIVLLFSGQRNLPIDVAFLTLGALAVAAGVGLGATATSARVPGKPTIQVSRLDDKSVRVQITGEGLASNLWYETAIRGYDAAGKDFEALGAARFSPGQDGKLNWTLRVNIADTKEVKIERLLIAVARESLDRQDIGQYCIDVTFTCLSVRLPLTPDQPPTTSTTTTTTTTTTT